jgi:predicted ATPase/transcriptional regulator with XRE-family HTH domain
MTSERNGAAARRSLSEFGGLLRGHRRAAGLTQEALAERAGLSVRGLQHLEAGDASPSRATLGLVLQALDALGLPPEDRARLAAAGRPVERSAGRRRAPGPDAPRGARPPPGPSLAPFPTPLTSYIGREQEVVVLRGYLRAGRLLTLTGPGGCGKTRLALRLAEAVAGDYEAGGCLVELAPVDDATLVTRAVATACGVGDESGRPLLATLVDVLRPKRLLLVLDNCEHVLDACARLADALLRACPALTVLATSREPLGVAGEVPWRVPPLALPPSGSPPAAEVLVGYEAVRLFVARAVAAQPAFIVTARNAPAVARLCERLDGLPLALELAAARLRALTVEQVLARLDDRFRLLTGGSRTALPHQQTLQATVDWSHALLSAPEQRLFARLAVFVGGWELEAAEAVGGGAAPGAAGVLDVLTHLVDKSLVVAATPSDGVARYHLLETLRQYAHERLEAGGAAAEARERHAAYYLALAERAEPELVAAAQVTWFDRLEAEHDNIRGALRWLTECGAAEPGLRLAAALLYWWLARGHRHEGAEWLGALLALPVQASPATRMRALNAAGFLAWVQGFRGAARAAYEESLAIARRTGDRRGVASALDGLGRVADRGSDHYAPEAAGHPASERGGGAAANAYHAESLAIQDELGDRHGAAWSHYFLGGASMAQRDDPAADAHYRASLTAFRALGDRIGLANALRGLGELARRRADLTTARALHEEGLALAQALGNREGVSRALDGLGAVATDQRDFATARACFAASLAHRRDLGAREGVAASLERFAGLAAAQGHLERALRLAGAGAALREAIGATTSPVWQADSDPGMRAARPPLDETGAVRARAWAEGRALSADAAVAYALA